MAEYGQFIYFSGDKNCLLLFLSFGGKLLKNGSVYPKGLCG